MKSSSNQASLGFSLSVRKIFKAIFLAQIDRVVTCSRLVDLIALHYPASRTRRHPFELVTVLHTHFLQQCFNLSDPAMKDAFFDTPHYREFVGLATQMLAEANTILLERGLMPKEGSAVDATQIAAPSSTQNKDKARDPEMHFSQKGNQWHFGMKALIGVGADSGLVHMVRRTSGSEHDITQSHHLLHGHEKSVWVEAGYQGVENRPGADPVVTWHVAMRPGKRKTLKQASEMGQLLDKATERFLAGI